MTTSLDTQLEKVEAEAQAAADKAAKLRAQKAELLAKARDEAAAQLEAEDKIRDQIATETLGEHADFNRTGLPRGSRDTINAAWENFAQTVRDGGNDKEAWLSYRATIATQVAHYVTNKQHLRRRYQQHYEAIQSKVTTWNAAIHDCVNGKAAGFSSAASKLADVNKEINEYAAQVGSTIRRDPDVTIPVMVENFGLKRPGVETWPEPNLVDPRSYSQAVDDALATVCQEAETQAVKDYENEIQLEVAKRLA